MNSKNEARMGMFLAVSEYCTKNAAIINSIPALLTNLNTFQSKLDRIRSIEQKASQKLTGITSNKEEARVALAEQTFILASSLRAYAKAAKDNELLEKVKITYYGIMRIKDTELVYFAQNINDFCNGKITELSHYGVTPGNLLAHADAIMAYKDRVSSPKTAVAIRKENIATLESIFTETMEFLTEEMDVMIFALFKTYPEFVDGYTAVRRIWSAPTYVTKTSGKVMKSDNTPAAGAQVEFVEPGTETVKYSTQSNEKGAFAIRGLKSGLYDVKVQYNGNPEPTLLKGVEIQRRKANKISVEV